MMSRLSATGCQVRQGKTSTYPRKHNGKKQQEVQAVPTSLAIHGVILLQIAARLIIVPVLAKQNRLVHIHQEYHHMVYMTWPGMFGNGVQIGIHQLIIPVLLEAILQALPAAPIGWYGAAAGTAL